MKYIPAKSILSGYTEQNNWFGTNYNMNIYKGCAHGCIYCDSRSDCYDIENFDEVKAKEDALSLLRHNLVSKRRKGVVGMGAMSDPYNPFEKTEKLTRGALELIDKHRFGVGIATKSDLIVRDIDVLRVIRAHSPAIVKITITTCDDELCRVVEPNVCESSKRFAAIKKLSGSGIYTGILMMPILPFIEDSEQNIVGIVQAASEAGAKFIYAGFGMTLRQNQRDYYYDQLDAHFPGLKQRYIHRYGDDYSCGVPNAKSLTALLKRECDKHGIAYRMGDIIAGYKDTYEKTQMSFLDDM